MDYFHTLNHELYAERVKVADIAEKFGTPCYVYSAATLKRHYQAFEKAFETQPHLICYAVKANSNLSVLQSLAQMGSGFDIVSIGELARVLKAGGKPDKIIFSGVGKQADEIIAALKADILCFNVESEPELHLLHFLAKQLNLKTRIALRVNPNVDPKVHPYISTGLKENKFGIPFERVKGIIQQIKHMPHLEMTGMACHIGSQITSLEPYLDALSKLLKLIGELEADGILLQHLDIGGGLGVRYKDETPPEPFVLAKAIVSHLKRSDLKIIVEPGRAIAANAGILVTKVLLLKEAEKNFCVVDAGMNDLLRPALYDAWQEIVPVLHREGPLKAYDVVGPICESADCFGKGRKLCVAPHDLLAIRGAGAYGFVMSSHYNTRPNPPEILVMDDTAYCVRKRETLDDLMQHESLLDSESAENFFRFNVR